MNKKIPADKKGFNTLSEEVQKKMDKALGRNQNTIDME